MENETFKDCVLKSYPTGSRYICNPPPQDTDNDTVILVNGYYDYDILLLKEGWLACDIDYEQIGEFRAYRKGVENYLVTEDPEFYGSYVKATEGARALNLLNKEDRIKLFQAVFCTKMEDDKRVVNLRENLVEDRNALFEGVQWRPAEIQRQVRVYPEFDEGMRFGRIDEAVFNHQFFNERPVRVLDGENNLMRVAPVPPRRNLFDRLLRRPD